MQSGGCFVEIFEQCRWRYWAIMTRPWKYCMCLCSGQESYQTCKVWCCLDKVCLSYYNVWGHGETSKFAGPPQEDRSVKTHNTHNTSLLWSCRISDQIWEGSGQHAWRSTSKCKACNFLLAVGGAMTEIKYWHIDLLRVGRLSSTTSFGMIRWCMRKL